MNNAPQTDNAQFTTGQFSAPFAGRADVALPETLVSYKDIKPLLAAQGVPFSTFKKWVDAGEIPSLVVSGRRRRFRPSAVRTAILAKADQPTVLPPPKRRPRIVGAPTPPPVANVA